MGALPARTARIVATTALLSCLIALLAPAGPAHAAAMHRPAGAVAVTTAGPTGSNLGLGAELHAVTLGASGQRTSHAADFAVSGAASGYRRHALDSATPRGPPGGRL